MDVALNNFCKAFQLREQKLISEIQQRQEATVCLLNKILYSRRLLVDHLEVLEECMGRMNITVSDTTVRPKEMLSMRNMCKLFSGTLIAYLISPKFLRPTTVWPSVFFTGTYSALAATKSIFKFRNRMVAYSLDDLIKNIDAYAKCMRRSITYFQEISLMNSNAIEHRHLEQAFDCISSSKEAIEVIYDATRALESAFPLCHKFDPYYTPMEELRDTKYFKNSVTDFEIRHLKDFYNIFAYVQSQFLLRLALTAIADASLTELNREVHKAAYVVGQLVQVENSRFGLLPLENRKKKELMLEEVNANRPIRHQSGPLLVLQKSSMELSARLIAIASECQFLDMSLQKFGQNNECFGNSEKARYLQCFMEKVDYSLKMSHDEFKRLTLLYNKLTNGQDSIQQGEGNQTKADLEHNQSVMRAEETQREEEVARDDFYACMQDMTRDDEKPDDYDRMEKEILNFEQRIASGKFQPVLNQLKDRIDPIRQEMLQKERQVLLAKGIDVEKLFKEAESESDSGSSQDDGGVCDNHYKNNGYNHQPSLNRSTLSATANDRYHDVREFLARKEAINIYNMAALLNAPKLAGEEDLLESDC